MPGVTVTINQEQVDHVNAVLRSAPEKAMTVYERALRRGLAAGKTQAYKEIRKRYDISTASLSPGNHTYHTFDERISRDASGVVGHISFAGAKIPLYRFHPSPAQRRYTSRFVNGIAGWRVTTLVSAADVRGQMIHRTGSFIATFQSEHTGIFSRTGETTATGKAALREWYGFSVADMLDYQPAREAIQERAAEVVQQRIDHEMLRALDETG